MQESSLKACLKDEACRHRSVQVPATWISGIHLTALAYLLQALFQPGLNYSCPLPISTKWKRPHVPGGFFAEVLPVPVLLEPQEQELALLAEPQEQPLAEVPELEQQALEPRLGPQAAVQVQKP